jgi:uncharacterized protein (TIGR02466 family)
MNNNLSPVEEITPKSILTPHYHFPSAIYSVSKPEFLNPVRDISNQYLQRIKKIKPKLETLFPMYQTEGFFHEAKLDEFTSYIAQAAWTILDNQGHDMKNIITYFQEMWCQEHQKYSGHDEHIHSLGAQISGFYFLDCPKDSCMLSLYDPRPGRRQINLPETDVKKITLASSTINFIPKAGDMFFINSWLPHGITRNASKNPMRMVHFNLGVDRAAPKAPVTAQSFDALPMATVI